MVATNGIDIREELVGAHSGQVNLEIGAYIDNRIAGVLQYSIFNDRIHISHVEVVPEFKRRKVATLMYRYLQATNPDVPIDSGLMTDEGAEFARSVGTPQGMTIKQALLQADGGLEGSETGSLGVPKKKRPASRRKRAKTKKNTAISLGGLR